MGAGFTIAEEFFYAIGDGIISESGNAEDTFGGFNNNSGEGCEFKSAAYMHGGKVSYGSDQSHHVLQSDISLYPDILELITLFDETDSLFDPPAGYIGLNDSQQ